MVFDSEESLRSAMYGSDTELAKQVVDAVLRDDIEIGSSVEEPVDQEAVEPTVDEPTLEEIVEDFVEPEKDLSVVLEEQNRQLKELYEKQVQDKEADLQAKLAERDEKIRIFEEAQKAKQESPREVGVELDDEDEDLASTYSRNTRKLVEAELEALKAKVANPELVSELAEIKAKLYAEEQKGIIAENERRAAEARNKLYNDLDNFSKNKPDYQIPVHVSEAVQEVNQYKDKIATTFGTDDPHEIEKIYRRVIREDTIWSREKKAKLDKAGAILPEYAKNYLNLVEVYELQRGKKFNYVAGMYEDTSLSLEDAYKLNNFSTLVSKAGSTEAKEIQKKLNQHQNAAVVLSNSDTSNAGGDESYTEADIIRAIRMKPTDLLKDKGLASTYVKYLRKEGMSVPSILNNF